MGAVVGSTNDRRGGLEANGSGVVQDGEELFESLGRSRAGLKERRDEYDEVMRAERGRDERRYYRGGAIGDRETYRGDGRGDRESLSDNSAC